MFDGSGRRAYGGTALSGPRAAVTWQSFTVVLLCVTADTGRYLITRQPGGTGYWLLLAGTVAADLLLALPVRWTREIALAHAVMAALTPILLPHGSDPTEANNAGLVVAAFLAGAWLRSWAAFQTLGGLMLGLMVSQMVAATGDWRERAVVTVTSCLLPWLVGRVTMARRTYIVELEQHADRLRRDKAATVQRAIAAERSTIARDLHDVISHHVSTIGMHAGAARLGLTDDDHAARKSLAAVEAASRAAMLDLRRLLAVLHGETARSAERQPGLDSLDELLDGLRRAGTLVRLTTRGQSRELPGSVDVAVYRTLQEALTNAIRYGDGGAAEVELIYREGGITLTVTNGTPVQAGPRESEDRPRRGLAGVLHRVSLLGGTLRYGPADDRRSWRLEADFPVEEA
ncbi:two-component sensor histidine kinase [Spongiactinospora rosea]|uniref:histidine kinase n=1 Tax=Spongiactinospora rosea TaxID=2248750 RepID=A0A366LZF9_9ACTN|nr:histidine kinase [Spongiactinospora rosea]RBQ18562.1 two-component sensor histidine kinase [Spongiactinospora rosea]